MAAPPPGPCALRGDETELFAEHDLPLRRAVRWAVSASDATIDDACSFAWLQLLRCQPDRDSVFAWLRRVAIREAWRLSARDRRDAPLDALVPSQEPQATSLERSHDARQALRTLAALPERQRRYLALLIGGYSYVEIAARHGSSYTNVNKHLVRARGRLRTMSVDD